MPKSLVLRNLVGEADRTILVAAFKHFTVSGLLRRLR